MYLWSPLLPGAAQLQAGGGPTYTLTCDQGSYTLTGQAATLKASRLLTAAQGSYTLTGQDAGLTASRLLTAAQGAYALTGQDAGLTAARLLTAGTGTYTATGQAVDFTYTPAAPEGVPGGGIGPMDRVPGGRHEPLTRAQLKRLKRLLGLERDAEVRAFLAARPGLAEKALQAFTYSGDADALLEQLLAQDAYRDALAARQQAADKEALLKRQAFLEDEAIALLLILAAMEGW